MAFAIIAVVMVSGMLLDYFNISVWSHEDARRMLALNVVADYTASRLNSFYTSLIGASGNATMVIKFPEKYLADSPNNEYEINYTVDTSQIGAIKAKLTFKNQADPLLSTSRSMGFKLDCTSPNIRSPLEQGNIIIRQECAVIPSGDLQCKECT